MSLNVSTAGQFVVEHNTSVTKHISIERHELIVFFYLIKLNKTSTTCLSQSHICVLGFYIVYGSIMLMLYA